MSKYLKTEASQILVSVFLVQLALLIQLYNRMIREVGFSHLFGSFSYGIGTSAVILAVDIMLFGVFHASTKSIVLAEFDF